VIQQCHLVNTVEWSAGIKPDVAYLVVVRQCAYPDACCSSLAVLAELGIGTVERFHLYLILANVRLKLLALSTELRLVLGLDLWDGSLQLVNGALSALPAYQLTKSHTQATYKRILGCVTKLSNRPTDAAIFKGIMHGLWKWIQIYPYIWPKYSNFPNFLAPFPSLPSPRDEIPSAQQC